MATRKIASWAWAIVLTQAVVFLMFAITASATAQGTSISRTSGFNLRSTHSSPVIPVEFNSSDLKYRLDVNLIFKPSAPPMNKIFRSPTDAAGHPIILDALQPFPLEVWEEFYLAGGPPVSDWHEEILTPGWEWLLPGDSRIPDPIDDPFGTHASLITKNGEPWYSRPIPMPSGVDDRQKVWVEFEPIPHGNVLDVHKALLWVGTTDNRNWGDGILNDGTTFDERYIKVREYPTPEPTSFALLVLGALALLVYRRR